MIIQPGWYFCKQNQNQNQNQFYFRVDVKNVMKQLWATIGDRKVAQPTIISALNLFMACTLNL
jgi:hypothetical protein